MTDTPPVIVRGGPIRTMDPARPAAAGLLLRGGLVDAVTGDVRQVNRWAAQIPAVRELDLRGRTAVPGFVDAHNHLSIAALYPRWADLSAVADPGGLYAALAAQARAEPEAGWIRGAAWPGPAASLRVDRDLLDSFGFDRPVLVADMSLHAGVVDSRGLELLGIGTATPDPVAGLIARDGRGRPTGRLVERAWSAAHAASMADYLDPDRWGEAIVARGRALLAHGITAVHDAACSPQAEQVYRDLARADRLPVSVLSMPHPAAIQDADRLGERLAGPPTGEGNHRFRIGPVKLFADGGRDAAVSAPGDPHTLGAGIYFPDIAEWIPRIAERGFRVAVHAVGDYAVRGALAAFDQVARRDSDTDHRCRIEHAIRPRDGQLAQMAALGVVACVQPGLVRDYGDGVLARMPAETGEQWFPFRSMAEAGIPVAASSDDPCAPPGMLRAAIAGATRSTETGAVFGPGQRMSLADWIHASTAGAAYAGGQEHERGRLAAGLRADLVVLGGDSVAPTVAETWRSGRRVFTAAQT